MFLYPFIPVFLATLLLFLLKWDKHSLLFLFMSFLILITVNWLFCQNLNLDLSTTNNLYLFTSSWVSHVVLFYTFLLIFILNLLSSTTK